MRREGTPQSAHAGDTQGGTSVRRAVADAGRARRGGGVDARLRLTLHFLGDVEREWIGAILAALPAAARRFTLRWDRAAVWHGGVAVLEPTEVPPALVRLQGDIGAVLRALGFETQARRFRPHLTLARHAQGARLGDVAPHLAWRPSRVVLVESVRGAAGGYRIVSRA
jgi:RNA 2',3'-cyclic 3'-phosphodiesterase